MDVNNTSRMSGAVMSSLPTLLALRGLEGLPSIAIPSWRPVAHSVKVYLANIPFLPALPRSLPH